MLPKNNSARLRVVLVNARNPLNIGAAARAMSNFGFLSLRLVTPYDVAFRRARSAVGAADVLLNAEVFPSVAEAVSDCALVVGTTAVGHRVPLHPLKGLQEGARILRKQLAARPVALLFGSERFGLSNADLSHCHWLMRIPTREENISMNLGQAVAVCLYELGRERAAKTTAKRTAADQGRPASSGEIERVTTILLEALRTSGYEKPNSSASLEEKVRRFTRRINLREADLPLWLGMLRQVLWKLRNPNAPERQA